METKKLRVQINNTYDYIELFNGIFRLTTREIQVLSAFVDIHLDENHYGYVFNPENRKRVAQKCNINSPYGVNQYIKNLKKKNAITIDDGEKYSIHKLLIPKGEGKIEFYL